MQRGQRKCHNEIKCGWTEQRIKKTLALCGKVREKQPSHGFNKVREQGMGMPGVWVFSQ